MKQLILIILILLVGLGTLFYPSIIKFITTSKAPPVSVSQGVLLEKQMVTMSPRETLDIMDKIAEILQKIIGSLTTLVGLILAGKQVKKTRAVRKANPVKKPAKVANKVTKKPIK